MRESVSVLFRWTLARCIALSRAPFQVRYRVIVSRSVHPAPASEQFSAEPLAKMAEEFDPEAYMDSKLETGESAPAPLPPPSGAPPSDDGDRGEREERDERKSSRRDRSRSRSRSRDRRRSRCAWTLVHPVCSRVPLGVEFCNSVSFCILRATARCVFLLL